MTSLKTEDSMNYKINAEEQTNSMRGTGVFVRMGSMPMSHERMQETCIKVNEKLDARGKRLEDLSPDEFVDLISDIK